MIPYMFPVDTTVSGNLRRICISGLVFEITTVHDGSVKGTDRYQYTLPDGNSYSHPTEAGCFLMILKWVSGGKWRHPDGHPVDFS